MLHQKHSSIYVIKFPSLQNFIKILLMWSAYGFMNIPIMIHEYTNHDSGIPIKIQEYSNRPQKALGFLDMPKASGASRHR